MAKASRNKAHQRVVNACVRCRQHKIKCSGDSPCTNCQNRKASCAFAGEEAKIQITKRRLSELKRRKCELEKENLALQEQLSGKQTTPNTLNEDVAGLYDGLDRGHPTLTFSPPDSACDDGRNGMENTEIKNSLSTGPPAFIRDIAGDPHYLGHTSNWSLTMRLLQLTHQSLYNCPYPSGAHHIDSMTYDFGWNGLRHEVIPDIRGLPSLDHALFLIKATEFHTGQMFHLFDEKTFMPQLYWFYEDPANRIGDSGLWFIHFLVLVALGKALSGSKNIGNVPPGADMFAKAFMMLPDYSFLWKEPYTASEILCSIALYLQSIDWRTSAHNMISQAQRMLLVHGFHTSIDPDLFKSAEGSRRQNIWWTVFILERRMSVLMGVPLWIRDQDIFTPLPNFPESSFQTKAAIIHVKLTKVFGQVVDTIYHGSHVLGSNFVTVAQNVLHDVANVASDLRTFLPVPERDSMNGISRLTGYMNLLYHECIFLATRPFLFNLVERHVHVESTNAPIPVPVKILIEICIESARKTAYILDSLMNQCLLDCFLPFHLESTISAGLVITMAELINPSSTESYAQTMRIFFQILDKMVHEGNLVAVDQKNELVELQDNCASLKSLIHIGGPCDTTEEGERPLFGTENLNGVLKPVTNTQLPGIDVGKELGTSPFSASLGQEEFMMNSTYDMSPNQLMTVADMLNTEDLLDWVTLPNDAASSMSEEDSHRVYSKPGFSI